MMLIIIILMIAVTVLSIPCKLNRFYFMRYYFRESRIKKPQIEREYVNILNHNILFLADKSQALGESKNKVATKFDLTWEKDPVETKAQAPNQFEI